MEMTISVMRILGIRRAVLKKVDASWRKVKRKEVTKRKQLKGREMKHRPRTATRNQKILGEAAAATEMTQKMTAGEMSDGTTDVEMIAENPATCDETWVGGRINERMELMICVGTIVCVDRRRRCEMDLVEGSRRLANGEGVWTSGWVGETSVLLVAISCAAVAVEGLWTRQAV